MTLYEICALLIMLCIAFLFVSVFYLIKSGGINVNITLKVGEAEQSASPVPAETYKEVELDPDQANLMRAARQIQELFLDEDQMVKQEVRKNG